MALERLTIYPEPDPKTRAGEEGIKVMFNPTTYSISKPVSWQRAGNTNDAGTNSPSTSFGGGGARTLSLELFYDVTEETPSPSRDVRVHTDEIVKLTRIRRDLSELRPPICRIEWGGQTEDFPFKGTVSNLDQQFVLFGENGRPLRAILKVSFLEFLVLEDDQRKTDPELTTRVVRRGDTLASIAAEVYRDVSAWRVIATANRIDDPFNVPAGVKLTLPKQ